MLVKMEIDLAKGFAPWKKMFIQNEHRLNAHGGKLVFAGTPSDNENKLTVIMVFESMESLKKFGLIKGIHLSFTRLINPSLDLESVKITVFVLHIFF